MDISVSQFSQQEALIATHVEQPVMSMLLMDVQWPQKSEACVFR